MIIDNTNTNTNTNTNAKFYQILDFNTKSGAKSRDGKLHWTQQQVRKRTKHFNKDVM